MPKVKICGITNHDDAMKAIDLGAWALGFNFYPSSPRFISFKKAQEIISKLSSKVEKVGVFVNASAQVIKGQENNVGLTMIQLHGNETPEFCSQFNSENYIKAFRPEIPGDLKIIKSYSTLKYILIDSSKHNQFGGTGELSDWDLAKKAKEYGSVILAGGLNPENILEACRDVAPFAVDVTSGVELRPGIKDTLKMKTFFEMVRKSEI